MAQFTDCLIIGAGQAGLAMSHCLSQRGVEHVVLERGSIAHRWTSARWQSLRLLTPGWLTRLPGQQLAKAADGFLAAGDLANRLNTYATGHSLPVVENVDVLALEPLGERFRAVTSRGAWIAKSVVIATGACDSPNIPRWGADFSNDFYQLASTQYRSADELPDGGVLVIGASATGIQLANEISEAGRHVMLAAGSHVRAPRRYRGRDIFSWLDESGFLSQATPNSRSPRQLMAQPSMQLIGSDDGREISLHKLADQGVEITGRAVAAHGTTVCLADDLLPMLDIAEKRRHRLLAHIDAHIERSRQIAPADCAAWQAPSLLLPLTGAVDLKARGITTILWATGYKRNYSWLHLDACDSDGELRQQGGVCDIPGLYALGLPFMRHRASSFIDGVGRDAEALAPAIVMHLGTINHAAKRAA